VKFRTGSVFAEPNAGSRFRVTIHHEQAQCLKYGGKPVMAFHPGKAAARVEWRNRRKHGLFQE
jgi:hypothetical protein